MFFNDFTQIKLLELTKIQLSYAQIIRLSILNWTLSQSSVVQADKIQIQHIYTSVFISNPTEFFKMSWRTLTEISTQRHHKYM